MATSAASDDPNRKASSSYDLFLAVLGVHVRLNIKNTTDINRYKQLRKKVTSRLKLLNCPTVI